MSEINRDNQAMLTIGALSQATGVPVETLRTWERRYGYPQPERTDSGHRVYPAETVERLRRVLEAIQRGHRAAQVVPSSDEELDTLLGRTARKDAQLPPDEPAGSSELDETLHRWLRSVRNLDGAAFDRQLQDEWVRSGAFDFLSVRVAPFLVAVGHEWAAGRLSVLHEHFASERLRDFLTAQWRPLSERNDGRPVFLTTLPGEAHSLGLHLAATVVAVCGLAVGYFGVNTPVEAIVDGVLQARPRAVLVSVSYAADPTQVLADLQQLRRLLPPEVELVVGGAGAPRELGRSLCLRDLDGLQHWAEQQRATRH